MKLVPSFVALFYKKIIEALFYKKIIEDIETGHARTWKSAARSH